MRDVRSKEVMGTLVIDSRELLKRPNQILGLPISKLTGIDDGRMDKHFNLNDGLVIEIITKRTSDRFADGQIATFSKSEKTRVQAATAP
jgi:hypothetical protein